MKRPISLRPLDYVLILLTVAAIIASVALLRRGKAAALQLIITAGKNEYVYPLTADRTVRIPGPLGETVIVIEDGSARFESSPCTNKICIHSGRLTDADDFAACLPNGILAHIEAR